MAQKAWISSRVGKVEETDDEAEAHDEADGETDEAEVLNDEAEAQDEADGETDKAEVLRRS